MILVDGAPQKYHPLYQMWLAMIDRCTRRKNKMWKHYGGRGIKVCRRWMDFRNFVADMGPRPESMTIHRVNNDRGYEPKNCIWATRKTQMQHTRANHLLTYDGETHPLSVWAEMRGLDYSVLHDRIKRGWSVEDALILPAAPYQGKSGGHRHLRLAKMRGTLDQFLIERRKRENKVSYLSFKRRSAARRKAGLCIQCGKPIFEGRVRCKRHVMLRREKERRRSERRRALVKASRVVKLLEVSR